MAGDGPLPAPAPAVPWATVADALSALSEPSYLDYIRTFAILAGAIAIPVVLWLGSRALERRRATLELIRTIFSEPLIPATMERRYDYRKHLEAAEARANPYNGNESKCIWDHVLVLNFFEAICAEITSKNVNRNLVFDSCGATVTGVRKVLLGRMIERRVAQESDYPKLVAVAGLVQAWSDSQQRALTPSIETPGD